MSKIGTRAERALATRRRMVAAAYRLFCDNGYGGTSMNTIADEAGVAVQTLYYTFHTKAALLGEALGAAIVGFDAWREPPPDPRISELLLVHKWWADFESAPTSADALRVFVTHGARILERVGPLSATLHGALGDPEAAAVVRVADERQADAYREVVRVLARRPDGLRKGLSETAATDILLVLFGADVHQALASGRGWSPARCTRFFHDLLAGQLLGSPPARGRGRRTR